MAELGRSGDYLESLGAHVHDAVTVAAGNEDAIRALQGLALTILRRPIADINELYAELDRFDRTEQRYAEIARAAAQEQEWENEVSHSLRLAFSSMSLPSTQPALAPTTALALSLATGIELWKQESERGEGGLLLAFTVATPESADSESVRLMFAEPRTVLALLPGSLAALLIISDKIVRAGRWVVNLVRRAPGRMRSAEAVARAFVENLRTAREAQEPKPLPLIRLDGDHSALPRGQETGVVLFLHGLMATDLGTFDGFMRRWLDPEPSDVRAWLKSSKAPPPEEWRWLKLNETLTGRARKAVEQAVAFVGWPHDTLTSIDQNAQELARWIDERMGERDCKIAFVCHSRGGLVARAAAETLYAKNKMWEQRICRCITFGTPHEGVALAEHRNRRLGAYVLAGLSRKELAAFTDMAAYLEQRDRIEGIENLQPPSAPNEPFLRKLTDLEWKNAPTGDRRRLDIYAVGGVTSLEDKRGWLLERLGRLYQAYLRVYTGETENDLVVPFSSATAANRANRGYAPIRTECDHFSYFSDKSCGAEAVSKAIGLLWDCFGLTDTIVHC